MHDAVAAAVRIVRDCGLPHRTTSMFTEIEGEWDEVFDVVKRATEAVLPFGSRVSLVLKADIRPAGRASSTASRAARRPPSMPRPDEVKPVERHPLPSNRFDRMPSASASMTG